MLFFLSAMGGFLQAQSSLADTAILLQQIADAQSIEGNNPERAKTIYRSVKAASEKIGWQTGVLKYYTNYTAVLNQQGRYDSALRLNLESVALARSADNKEYLIATQLNTGISYYYLNDASTAIEYYLKVLPILENEAKTNRLGIVYDNLGSAFDAIRDYKEAKNYFKKAMSLYRQTTDTIGLCFTSNNFAKTLTALEQYDSAQALINDGMALAGSLNNDYLYMIFQLNQTNLHMHRGEYAQMQMPGWKALQLAQQLDDAGSMTNACYAIAWAKLFSGQTDSANIYAQMSLQAARKTGSKKEQSEVLELLGQIALMKGNTAGFDRYNNESDSLAEAVLTENIQQTSLALAAKFESEKKESLITLLQKETQRSRQLIVLLAAMLGLLLFGGWLLWRNKKQREVLDAQEARMQEARIEQLEKEKQLLASQSLLRGQEEERSRLSRELHDGVGSMLSGIKLSLGAMKGNILLAENDARLFAGALNKLDETISELRRVAHSMMPEALLRLGLSAAVSDYCEGLQATGKIAVQFQHYGMDARMPNDVEIVVYRIIQELFTNVLKHAEASDVMIQLMRHDDHLSLTFEDNGKGMDTMAISAGGAGLANIRARVDYLRGQFDLRSSPGKGTSVHIEIPQGA